MSKTIDELNLAPLMRMRAEELLTKFPEVRFTSGRRTLHEQAHAMAVNYMQDPQFIIRTYVRAAELMSAIQEANVKGSVDSLTEVIYDTLQAAPGLVKGPHLDGHAVDLRPMEFANKPTPIGQQVIDWIKMCPDTTDFRDREGGLIRWHWACVPGKEV